MASRRSACRFWWPLAAALPSPSQRSSCGRSSRTISSPSNIPIYGEVIVARWAYEALAVYQFKENKYQKPFYIYDEAMSISDFKRNYWLKSLQNKIDFCIRNFDNKGKSEEFQSALNLLNNEIVREMTSPRSSKLIFSKYTQINPTDITLELLNEMNQYLELVRKYYVKLYNKANNEKDQFISKFQSTEQGKEQFLELKRRYHNESLSEFVKNSGEVERIIEYDGHLIQKVDPIYLYPESRFIRSHFYAPAKSVFGYYVSTYWVNVIVIWLSSIMLYLILYYRLFKRLLDRLEQLSGDNND